MSLRSGVQTVANQSTEGRAKRDVSPIINLLEPNKYPLTVMLTKGTNGMKVTGNYKFEHLEDTLLPKFDVLGGSLAAGDATMTVTNYARFRKGDLVRVNQNEIVYVTATPATTSVAITRSAGDVSATTASSGDQLHIISNSFGENSASGDILSNVKTNPYNYTQTFKTAYGWSGRAMNSDVYGESDKAYDEAQAIIEHSVDIERMAILGQRWSGTDAASKVVTTSRGALRWISTNVVDAGGEFTEEEHEEAMRIAFRYGSEKKLGVYASKLVSIVNGWGRDKVRLDPNSNKYGISFFQYHNAGYNLDLVRHPLLENSALTDLTGLAGTGMILDVKDLTMRYIANRYMKTEQISQDLDGEKWQILSDCGLQMAQEKKHLKITGATS